MSDHDFVNHLDGDRYWDEQGLEWTTKHTRWATAAQANSFAKRETGIGILDGPGTPVRWLGPVEAKQWWLHARNHFEVPGATTATPGQDGKTWTAHIYRRSDDRRIVFEANC